MNKLVYRLQVKNISKLYLVVNLAREILGDFDVTYNSSIFNRNKLMAIALGAFVKPSSLLLRNNSEILC